MNTVYPRTSSLAVVSLIFGILAWVPALPLVGALVAIICGHAARSEIARAPSGAIEGGGMALAGLILGWIQVGLAVLIIGFLVLIAIGAVALHRFW